MKEFKNELAFEETLSSILISEAQWKGDPESGVNSPLVNPDEERLIKNFSDIVYNNNRSTDKLGDHPLTKSEVQKIIDEIEKFDTPAKRYEFLQTGSISIIRDCQESENFDMMVSLSIINLKDRNNSIYQVVRQPEFNVENEVSRDSRGDLMLLMNGLPLVHIELKNDQTDGVNKAVRQIDRYIQKGIYNRGLYSMVMVFIGMTPSEMKYFANPGNSIKSDDNEDPTTINTNYLFSHTDNKNYPINHWKDLVKYFFKVSNIHNLISDSMISKDDELIVLRPYQRHAIDAIVNRMKEIDMDGDKTQLGGYIWHTTGSGKTFTMFKASDRLLNGFLRPGLKIDKVITLLDRKDLNQQTLKQFKSAAYYPDDIVDTKNTEELISALLSTDDRKRSIVTSIQKAGRISSEYGVSREQLETLKNKNIVFIVDEAHRSTFGELLSDIKFNFPSAIFFGFSGTPILEDNMKKDSTTSTIFGDELHRYDISNGINDGNVLGFDVEPYGTINMRDFREKYAAQVIGKNPQEAYQLDKNSPEYKKFAEILNNKSELYSDVYLEDKMIEKEHFSKKHMEKVSEYIVDNFNRLTHGGRYSAILATSSIKDAIEYYTLLQDKGPNLKITAVFDASVDESEGSLFKEQQVDGIISDYNKNFNQSYTTSTHKEFKYDVMDRLAKVDRYKFISDNMKLDIVIVVNQLLTGYDSKWINTVFLDKIIKYENIIQTFSRTNRLETPGIKDFGNIVYFRKINTMSDLIKKAVDTYSTQSDFVLYVDKLPENITEMNIIKKSIDNIFDSEKIINYTKLPENSKSLQKFINLYYEFHKKLQAAFVQGFRWERTDLENEFSETDYLSWSVRIQDLRSENNKKPQNDKFYIPTRYVGQIYQSKKIDDSYFELDKKFIDLQAVKNEREANDIRNEILNNSYMLSEEQQEIAKELLEELRNNTLTIIHGKSFMEYIKDRSDKKYIKNIKTAAQLLSVDYETLKNEMHTPPVDKALIIASRDRVLETQDQVKSMNRIKELLKEDSIKKHVFNILVRGFLEDFLINSEITPNDYIVDLYSKNLK